MLSFIRRFCHLLWRVFGTFWPFKMNLQLGACAEKSDIIDETGAGAELSNLICFMIEKKCRLRMVLRAEYLTVFVATAKMRAADKIKMQRYDALREALNEATIIAKDGNDVQASYLQLKMDEIDRIYVCYLYHRGMYVRKVRMVLGDIKQVYEAIDVSPSRMTAEELKQFTEGMETQEIVATWRAKIRKITAESEEIVELTEKLEDCVKSMQKLLEFSVGLSKGKWEEFESGDITTNCKMVL